MREIVQDTKMCIIFELLGKQLSCIAMSEKFSKMISLSEAILSSMKQLNSKKYLISHEKLSTKGLKETNQLLLKRNLSTQNSGSFFSVRKS